MAIIETKYNVGDVVYKGDSSWEEQRIECPDCLGTKIVHITFADKRIEELSCYTCRTYGFPEYSTGFLDFKNWIPKVRKGVVVCVEFMGGKAQYKVNYGMEFYEGRSYEAIHHDNEDSLYSNKEEALVEATQQVERQTASELESIFKKKGSFAKRLEESHLRYNTQEALKKERDMNRWIKAIRGNK